MRWLAASGVAVALLLGWAYWLSSQPPVRYRVTVVWTADPTATYHELRGAEVPLQRVPDAHVALCLPASRRLELELRSCRGEDRCSAWTTFPLTTPTPKPEARCP
jgi:hypothetical protein